MEFISIHISEYILNYKHVCVSIFRANLKGWLSITRAQISNRRTEVQTDKVFCRVTTLIMCTYMYVINGSYKILYVIICYL